MDYQQIIDKYYPEDNQLRYILMTHSTLVMKRAVRICDLHPELLLDRQFIIEAAMLHDIGKVGVSDLLLKKKGKLSDEEFAVMREHIRLRVPNAEWRLPGGA